MNSLKDKRILITGASSGIGRATALLVAQQGAEVFLVARRTEKLEELQDEIAKKAHILTADVNDPGIENKLSQFTGEKIDVLINNAGLALGRDKVETSPWTDIETMINTNITANFRIAHAVVPWMLKNGGGDIINLCSVAGHYTYQGGAVYCATKHAVLAFTRTLREETAGRNLRVMQISPGMVDTEFSTVRFKGNSEIADSVYKGMDPLTAEDIADMMLFMLTRPRHVVIDEIITMPMAQGSIGTVVRK
ncbi:MAG: SDR family NAD(P)-dependent oxidoreductase [Bacteriovoracaceae bacterium]